MFSRPMAGMKPVIAPASMAALSDVSAQTSAPVAATARAIWMLWWSMRPGVNCWKAMTADVVKARATQNAGLPPRRIAIEAAPAMVVRSQSQGQTMRMKISAPSWPRNGFAAR